MTFAAQLGVAPRVWRLPAWLFSLLGLVSKDLGGMREMLYQWEVPYVVDDSLFEQTFGVKATPSALAIRESVRAAGLPTGPAVQTAAA